MIFNPVIGGESVELGTKVITANGTYSASSDNLDGYSEITANVPNSYTASDVGKVVQNVYGYIRTNNVALNITLSNWLYRASDKFEFEYKNIGSHTNNWGVFIATVANTNPLWIQYNLWGGRSCMNVRHNGTWSGDGNYSFNGPNNTARYYKVTLDGSAFSIMSGSARGTYDTTEVSQTLGTTSDTDTVNPVLFPTSSNNTLNVEFYGLRVYRDGTLVHNYQPAEGGVYDAVDGTTHLATASGGIYGGSSYVLVPQTSKSITANDTYDTTTNNSVVVNVPNSYSASDEGKVVSNGELVAQTSATYSTNNTYDTTLIDSVTVDVPTSGGIQVITRSDWDALTTAQKQAYGLIAIQDAVSGFDRGELVYGADYLPAPTLLYTASANTRSSTELTYTFSASGTYQIIIVCLAGDTNSKTGFEFKYNGTAVTGNYSYPSTNNNNRINIWTFEFAAAAGDVFSAKNTSTYNNAGYQLTVFQDVVIANVGLYDSRGNNGQTFQINLTSYYLQVAKYGYYSGNNTIPTYEIDNVVKTSTATPNSSQYWYGGTHVLTLQ